ncbi:MAG TPA: hypothetical protein VFC35_10290 [Gemmatimonadaceae bacterium]|nr:hypothetical protein [Gemmatimonadaceae bacterium]
MTDEPVVQRISTEGADQLTLAGVNDENLVELSKQSGAKVALRGDTLTITGSQDAVSRATPIAKRMIDTARQQMELTADDVLIRSTSSAVSSICCRAVSIIRFAIGVARLTAS